MGEVEEIERGNLEIMADLFECKIEDLKISRYMAQDNLKIFGINVLKI